MLSIKKITDVITVTLNHEEIKKDSQRITKIKPFINKYNWKGITFHQKNMIGENLSKTIEQMLSMFCMLKEKIYIQLMFQNITQIIKNQLKYQKSE